jgi:hypothetical protein
LEGEEGLLHECTGERKVVILVPGQKIELDGDYLAVLGDEAVTRWKDYVPANAPDKEKIQYVQREGSERLRWMHFELDRLTPLQLNVNWKKPEDGTEGGPDRTDPIARVIYAQLFTCSLLYMAGHSAPKSARSGKKTALGASADDHWIVTFAADKDVVEVEVGNANTLGEMLPMVSSGNPWQAARTIGSLALWIYEATQEGKRDVSDRLIVVQSVIASTLRDSDPSANCSELVRRATEISKRVEGGWESFIKGKLEKYFSQVKELEDTVEITTKTYNEQVQTLTKALIDNMLAAVGVVVGSFIAAIFKSPFQPYIFVVGTGIYVAYLRIFPIYVGLTSAWHRFKDSHAAFRKRREDFTRRLSKREVTDIVGDTVRSSERRFISWFLTTKKQYKYVQIACLLRWVLAILASPYQIWTGSDNFEVTGVSYGEPATSEVVPLLVRGKNFDRDEEIVVTIGDSGFTNIDGQTLRVYGSSVLALSPRQKDLASVKQKNDGFVLVAQGSSEPKRVPLPGDPAPIPLPAFEQWNVAMVASVAMVQASGSNLGSISDIGFNGAKLNFKVSEDGHRLELSDSELLKAPLKGKSLEITLKNGERMQQVILAEVSNKSGR